MYERISSNKIGKELRTTYQSYHKWITMIDPATGWFEINEYKDRTLETIANLLEQKCITRYNVLELITYDKGGGFICRRFQEDMEK